MGREPKRDNYFASRLPQSLAKARLTAIVSKEFERRSTVVSRSSSARRCAGGIGFRLAGLPSGRVFLRSVSFEKIIAFAMGVQRQNQPRRRGASRSIQLLRWRIWTRERSAHTMLDIVEIGAGGQVRSHGGTIRVLCYVGPQRRRFDARNRVAYGAAAINRPRHRCQPAAEPIIMRRNFQGGEMLLDPRRLTAGNERHGDSRLNWLRWAGEGVRSTGERYSGD